MNSTKARFPRLPEGPSMCPQPAVTYPYDSEKVMRVRMANGCSGVMTGLGHSG